MKADLLYKQNSSQSEYFTMDEIENAIDSLETALFIITRNDTLKWKWISSCLLHSLYSFCIANLTGTNYETVLTSVDNPDDNNFIKRGEDNWKKSKTIKRESGLGYTIIWEEIDQDTKNILEQKSVIKKNIGNSSKNVLIDFWSALARVQDGYGQMNMYIFSKPLVLTEIQWVSIEFIFRAVNEFIKFVPMLSSNSVIEFKKHCSNLLIVIKFLSLETGNILFFEKGAKKRIIYTLDKLKEYFSTETDQYLLKDFHQNNEEDLKNVKDIRKYLEDIKHDKKINRYIKFIENGENDVVEFKSTLRYDLIKNEINKVLEFEVAKAISAFMNSKGGLLFIGIKDNGDILGLSNDFDVLKGENKKDVFQRTVNSVINKLIGKIYHIFIKISFEKIHELLICIIDVKKSNNPTYVTYNSKKQFFIRASGESRSLDDIEDCNKYINMNW